MGIHLTIIGSGAVYNGDKLFTETDEPNFKGSFYSKCRVILEEIIRSTYMEDLLYLRILYPITADKNSKCFIEKLKSRASNIHDTRITVSILPLLLPELQSILDRKITGILNFVNDGVTSPSELLSMLNIEHKVSHDKTNRGTCCLDTSKLKEYINVEGVRLKYP
jgi:hypothetical protein